MRHRNIRRTLPGAAVFAGILALAAPHADAATGATCSPLTQGYWKTHPAAWAGKVLTIGTTTYTQAQLLTILQLPTHGDASLILADQLIAALLDITVDGTDSSPIAATIADADTLLGAGPIPEGVKTSSPLGQKMVADAAILDSFNNGHVTMACGSPTGSCQSAGSLAVLATGSNVVAYVPKGSWSTSTATGVSVVNIEGSSVTPTVIPTANTVNSCASNSTTGTTVCTANNTDVYLLSGTTLNSTLTSGGSGMIDFSGGLCTNCNVAMDATNNRAVIGLSLAGGTPGYQFLDLSGTPSFEPAFASPAGAISESLLLDPIRNLLLSASELNNNYELVDVSASLSPKFYENNTGITAGVLDASAEECSTGIALAPAEFSSPSQVYIADLTQATLTAGSPGTWTAPSQVQTLADSILAAAGPSGMAVAQGTHTAVIADEFGGNAITAAALPTTSGGGPPAIGDWVTCGIGSGFAIGDDPHTVTAYQSPTSGDGIAVLANEGATTLAVVDMTKMLNPAIVARSAGTHACAAGTLPAGVVSFVAVP